MHSIPAVGVHPNGKWLCGNSLDNQVWYLYGMPLIKYLIAQGHRNLRLSLPSCKAPRQH